MKAPRVAVLILLLSGVWSYALASVQSKWEGTWYSLLGDFERAPNDVVREDIITRLEGYGSEVPQHLSAWVGTLQVFRYSPDRSMVGGSITLQDADHTSLHGILFYCPAGALGPAGVADPSTLREGVLVEVSGVLAAAGFWGQTPPKDTVQSANTFTDAGLHDAPRRPGTVAVGKLSAEVHTLEGIGFAIRDLLDGFSQQTVAAIENGSNRGSILGLAQAEPPAPPKPWVNPAEEIVKYAPKFLDRIPRGVIITVRLEKLVPFTPATHRAADFANLRNLLAVAAQGDAAYTDLVSTSDGGGGLLDEVRTTLTCERLQTLVSAKDCAEAMTWARKIGISCEGEVPSTRILGSTPEAAAPFTLKQRATFLAAEYDTLQRAIYTARFEGAYRERLGRFRDQLDLFVSDVQQTHENCSRLHGCLADQSTPPSSAPAPIQPPKGLRWGMTYQEVRQHLTPEGLDIDKPKKRGDAQGVILPDTCTATKAKGMVLQGQKANEGWLVFNRRGGLCGVLLRYEFRCEAKKLGSTCPDVASVFLGQLASALEQKCTGRRNGALIINAPGKRDDSEAVCFDAASNSGMMVHAAWTALTNSNYHGKPVRPQGTCAVDSDPDCICCVVRIQYARGDWTRLDPNAQGM